MDGSVLDVPKPLRWLIVQLFILPRKDRNNPQKPTRRSGQMKVSPLIVTSKLQQKALQDKLDMPVELGMRYGKPSTEDALDSLVQQGVEDLFVIPLYPHYAMSSYETAVIYLNQFIKEKALNP